MESKVIFKNVGQGDTIVLQVEMEDKFLFGIIDCKLTPDRRNVVAEHLTALRRTTDKTFEVEFVAITHPHEDHYDGIETLLQYFIDNDIPLSIVYHSFLLDLAIEVMIPKSYDTSYTELVKVLSEKKVKLKFEESEMSALHELIFKAGDIDVRCFSPSDKEKITAIATLLHSAIDSGVKKLVSKTNLFSNYKSSILKITNTQCSAAVLLTSDAEKSSFKRIMDSKNGLFWSEDTFIAVQIPHHGSFYNYHEPFWKLIREKSPEVSAIISVGSEREKHPSAKVLTSLMEMGFKHVCTTGKMTEKRKKEADRDTGRVSHDLDYICHFSYDHKNDFIRNL